MFWHGARSLLVWATIAASALGAVLQNGDNTHPSHTTIELLESSLPAPSSTIQIHMKKSFTAQVGKANAAFVILARNSDKNGLLSSLRQNEERFNKKFNYPYVLLNDKPFDEEFMQAISNVTEAQVKFGTIDPSMWGYPEWIDQEKAAKDRKDLASRRAPYGDSESYRHMCRLEYDGIGNNAVLVLSYNCFKI